ncbi:hypothetical protein ACEUAY_02990 [Aeromonas veronii]
MNSKQNVCREEYRSLDNWVTCILQQRWPASEISQWVGMFKGKQQFVACAPPVAIDRGGTIRYALTWCDLFITLGSITNSATPGAVEQLNLELSTSTAPSGH